MVGVDHRGGMPSWLSGDRLRAQPPGIQMQTRGLKFVHVCLLSSVALLLFITTPLLLSLMSPSEPSDTTRVSRHSLAYATRAPVRNQSGSAVTYNRNNKSAYAYKKRGSSSSKELQPPKWRIQLLPRTGKSIDYSYTYNIIKPSRRMLDCLNTTSEAVPATVTTNGSLFLYENWDDIIARSADEKMKEQYCILLYSFTNKFIESCRPIISAGLDVKYGHPYLLREVLITAVQRSGTHHITSLFNTPTGFDANCPGSEEVRANTYIQRNKTKQQLIAMWNKNKRKRLAALQNVSIGVPPWYGTSLSDRTYMDLIHEGLGTWGSVSWLFALGYPLVKAKGYAINNGNVRTNERMEAHRFHIVLHQVRHPLAAIRTIELKAGEFSSDQIWRWIDMSHTKVVKYINTNHLLDSSKARADKGDLDAKILYECMSRKDIYSRSASNLERAAWHWLCWNQFIELSADIRYRVEDTSVRDVCRWATLHAASIVDPEAASVCSKHDPAWTYNAVPAREKLIYAWDRIDAGGRRLSDMVKYKANQYGYS